MDPVLAEGLAVELGRAQPGVELLRREVRGLADRANELGLPTQENPAWRLSGFLQDSADVADEIRHRIELLVRWQEAVFLGHATEPLWATSVSTSGLPEVIALLNELAYVDENTVAAWVVMGPTEGGAVNGWIPRFAEVSEADGSPRRALIEVEP